MNLRLTVTAAIAVLLASLSLSAVLAGNGWIGVGIGAVIIVALAGAVTRTSGSASAITAAFLALIAIFPLLAAPRWIDRIGGLVIVVLAAASLTGVRILRGYATLVTYLAGLLIYLNILFASARSYGYVLPSHDSLAMLARLYHDAFSEFSYSPPVPDVRGVSLVAGAGIGLIAVAVDILAVRLRRPAIAGLPLLLLFSVPVASNLKSFGSGQVITFAAGLTGYLALLSADGRERLRMWGRLVTFRYVQPADETGVGPDTRELAASGRRIGLAAMCLAVIVPIILPSTRTHDVFGTTNNGNEQAGPRSQLDALLLVQDILTGKSVPVLTYTTTSQDPQRQYLQQWVLNYNGTQNKWLVTDAGTPRTPYGTGQLPYTAPGVVAGTPATTVQTNIHLDKDQTGEAILPMPYAPVDLSAATAGWLEEPNTLMVYNPNQTVSPSNLQYTVTSKEADPSAKQLGGQLPIPSVVVNQFGGYNGPDQSQLLAIAYQHGTGSTELQQALGLQNWFNSGAFTYTLRPHLPNSRGWLLKFLTKERRGFCSQYAFAFAVLARLLQIPSRIVVGYTAGTQLKTGTWQVTSADAHAWPELYFPGYGWLRFEPTPGSSLAGQGTAVAPLYATGTAGSSGRSQTGNSGQASPGAKSSLGPGGKKPNSSRLGDRPGARAGLAGQRQTSALGFAIGIPLALFLLIAWPALTRLTTRRRRWMAASSDAALAHAAWHELTDDLTDYGLGCGPGETPRAVARRVVKAASLDATAMHAITRIGMAEERARYARAAESGAGLAADVRTVRRAVAASVSARERARARLLPASTLLAARRLLNRVGDFFGWLDSSWPAMRRQVRSLVHKPG